MIQKLLKDEHSPAYSELSSVMKSCDFNLEVFLEIISESAYEQLVKQKSKEVTYVLIKKEEFYTLIKDKIGV